MNILIVDDEFLIVDEIVQTIDWQTFGIDSVATAFNLDQASRVIHEQGADLILCDIEMPGGTGLELLGLVKSEYPQTEVILLTCHADFKYAREAVQLGSFDYLLKPVDFSDLAASLRRAIDKINKTDQLMEASRFGEYWHRHLPVMIERFWYDIINRGIEADPAAIRRVAKLRDIPIPEQMRIFPVLITLRRWHSDWGARDQKSREFAFKNVAREIILHDDARGLIIDLERNRLVVLMTNFDSGQMDFDELKSDCDSFIATCNQYLDCDLNCTFGEASDPCEMADQIDRLIRIDQQNISFDNAVLSGRTPFPRMQSTRPDVSTWRVMLANGQFRQVFNEAMRYLNSQNKTGRMDNRSLTAFQQDFTQLFHAALADQNIQHSDLLSDEQSVHLEERSSQSIADMLNWIKWLDQKTDEYLIQSDDNLPVTQQAIRYIKQNLDQDLSRDTIARQLFISPDYLDRLFKNEMDVSVTRYLLEQRLAAACKLLAESKLSVSLIAGEAGFNSVRTFNRAFKTEIGQTPAEFRKNNGSTKALSEGGFS